MTVDSYPFTTKKNQVEYDAISVFGVRVKEGLVKKLEIFGTGDVLGAFCEQVYTANKYRSVVHIKINGRIVSLFSPEPKQGEKGAVATLNLVVIAKVLNRDKLDAKEVVAEEQPSLEGLNG
jgi:hypothetical protein